MKTNAIIIYVASVLFAGIVLSLYISTALETIQADQEQKSIALMQLEGK